VYKESVKLANLGEEDNMDEFSYKLFNLYRDYSTKKKSDLHSVPLPNGTKLFPSPMCTPGFCAAAFFFGDWMRLLIHDQTRAKITFF